MSERFSAVFVRFGKDDPKAKVYMFQAPYYSRIEIGDMVTVESSDDTAWVVDTEQLNLNHNSDKREFELLYHVAGVVELPLKRVLSVIQEKKLEYEEDE